MIRDLKAGEKRIQHRAEAASSAVDATVLSVWNRLLAILERGGDWLTVYRDATAAIQSLP